MVPLYALIQDNDTREVSDGPAQRCDLTQSPLRSPPAGALELAGVFMCGMVSGMELAGPAAHSPLRPASPCLQWVQGNAKATVIPSVHAGVQDVSCGEVSGAKHQLSPSLLAPRSRTYLFEGWPKASRAPVWLCKGAEGGKNHPLGTVPQPQEVPATPAETSQAGGHRSLGLGSCKSFSVNPVEIGFPFSLFTATPTPLHSPLTPISSPEMTGMLKVTCWH